jgi:LacI family transcriptional regulator
MKYHVILTVSREKEIIEQQNIENLIGMRVDGLLVCLSQETKEKEIFSRVKKMKIPMVFYDRAFLKLGFPAVVFDDKAGALEAIGQIINSGYTRIAHFAGYSSVNIGKSQGYRSACGNTGCLTAKTGFLKEDLNLTTGLILFCNC